MTSALGDGCCSPYSHSSEVLDRVNSILSFCASKTKQIHVESLRLSENASNALRLSHHHRHSLYGGEYVLQLSRSHFIDACCPTSCAARYSNTARSWNVARGGECRGNNACFTLDRRGRELAWITATRTIRAGEEILTAYGGGFTIPRTDSESSST